jgi:integrase
VPAAKRAKSKAAKLAKHKAPEVMAPEDVKRFLDAVATVALDLVPFWTLKFFAGIRDAEAARMTWEMINLKGKEIHLPATITKTGEQRTVKIEPNLEKWLHPYSQRKGPVAPASMARRYWFKRVIKSLERHEKKGKAVPFVFPSNAARHSFGTFHLYAFRNAGETALQLGHKGNPAMLHEHYKNPAAEKLAAAYWSIVPAKSVGNVISIKRGRVA